MRPILRSTLTAALALSCILPALARKAPPPKASSKAETEAATRLQVFLDRANFSPGKLDGRYGEFTLKALALFRESTGAPAPAATPPAPNGKPGAAPDVSGLPLASADPVFITYTVTEEDLHSVGKLAGSVAEQARQKSLPYRDAADAIGEKFHSDPKFLAALNPGKMKSIKAGDQLTVPNVEPFEVAAVKDLKPGSEIDWSQPANDFDDQGNHKEPTAPAAKKDTPEKGDKGAEPNPPATALKVDASTNMLTVYESGKLIAAYPVTIGSAKTESPMGEWIVRGVVKWPTFRYDKAMLQHGERSSHFHLLPPGPRNPVGVIWIALNKKGIGIHGTSDPDSIGRSASHGCIRLANWDIVRLAAKVKAGVPVSIH